MILSQSNEITEVTIYSITLLIEVTDQNMAVGRVFSCSVILITLISLSVLLRLQTTSFKKKSSHRTRGAYHDPKYLGEYTGNANFQNAQYRQGCH